MQVYQSAHIQTTHVQRTNRTPLFKYFYRNISSLRKEADSSVMMSFPNCLNRYIIHYIVEGVLITVILSRSDIHSGLGQASRTEKRNELTLFFTISARNFIEMVKRGWWCTKNYFLKKERTF